MFLVKLDVFGVKNKITSPIINVQIKIEISIRKSSRNLEHKTQKM
jgi:hypothetical protein